MDLNNDNAIQERSETPLDGTLVCSSESGMTVDDEARVNNKIIFQPVTVDDSLQMTVEDSEDPIHNCDKQAKEKWTDKDKDLDGLNIAQIAVVRGLLKNGVDVNARDLHGDTPLHWAARYGVVETVQLFVQELGQDVNLVGRNGAIPLHMAAGADRLPTVRYLLEQGADVNRKMNNGKTPLHLAAYHSNFDLVVTLVDHGANVNIQDEDGETSLHVAADAYRLNILHYLARNGGANVDIQRKDGKTALDIRYKAEMQPLLDYLNSKYILK